MISVSILMASLPLKCSTRYKCAKILVSIISYTALLNALELIFWYTDIKFSYCLLCGMQQYTSETYSHSRLL